MKPQLAGILATVAGLGERLPAPGTLVGSPLGLLLFLAAATLAPGAIEVVAVVGAVVLAGVAVWACGAEASRLDAHDPGVIVLDETAGQWLTLAVVVVVLRRPPRPVELVLGFVLFRILDVVKPWPVRALEQLPGGWGIVADDVAAGLLAGVALLTIRALLPGLQ